MFNKPFFLFVVALSLYIFNPYEFTASAAVVSKAPVKCNKATDVKNAQTNFGASSKAWTCFYNNLKSCKPAMLYGAVSSKPKNIPVVFSVYGTKDGYCLATGPLYEANLKKFRDTACKISKIDFEKYSRKTLPDKAAFNIAANIIFRPHTEDHKNNCDTQSPERAAPTCSFITGCVVDPKIKDKQLSVELKTELNAIYNKLLLDDKDKGFIDNLSGLVKGDAISIIKINPTQKLFDFVSKLNSDEFLAFLNYQYVINVVAKDKWLDEFIKKDGVFPRYKTVVSGNNLETVRLSSRDDLDLYIEKIFELTKNLSSVDSSNNWQKYTALKIPYRNTIIEETNQYTSFVLWSSPQTENVCGIGNRQIISGLVKPDRTIYLFGTSCYDMTSNTISSVSGSSWSTELVSKFFKK